MVSKVRILMKRPCLQLAATVGMLLFSSPLWVPAETLAAATAAPSQPITRADTSSPRATLQSLLDACNELYELIQRDRYFDRNLPEHRAIGKRAVDCLDSSDLPEFALREQAGEAAVCLKEILDRIELPPIEEIPDMDAIQEDGAEKHSRWEIPGTRITIARVEEGPQKHEYLFTAGTVGRAREYYEDVEHLPYRTTGPAVSPGFLRWYLSMPGHPVVAAIVDRLPDWTREQALGLTIWKWPGLLIGLSMAMALMALTYMLQQKFTGRWRQSNLFLYCLGILFPVVAVLIPLAFRIFAKDYLTLRGTPLYVMSFSANLVALLAALFVVFGITNRVAELIIASPNIQSKGLDAQLIRIVSKLVSLAGVVFIFIEGGRYLGIPVTTLLASAGVGGLAIALAAQDTLKGLFGTITLMADKPFRVGDRIVFNKYDGVVEDIGLRSTRVRMLTGNQVTVPNDELARIDIENVGRRPHIRRSVNLHVPLDTPRERIEAAVDVIRTSLQDHEGMSPDFPPRVYFDEFNPDSFNIRIIYWYHPPKYWDFLDFSQRLNIKICRAFEEQGISFSLPIRITYTDSDGQPQPLELRSVDPPE